MKKIGLLLFVIMFLTGSVSFGQTSPQAMFDEANTFFEDGELFEAMKMYRSIKETGQVSGALYLNMGITAVQLDSMGLAKFYFLKASEFPSTQARADQALDYVGSQFSRQSATLPKLPWDRAVEWINEVLTAAGLFIIGFLLSVTGLVLLYLGWLEKIKLSKVSAYIMTFIIAGTTLAGLAFYADYVNQRYDEAVLISSSQRVLQSPKQDAILESIAYEGYDLTIDHWKSEEQPGWLYVRLGNGQYGWIQGEGVKIL